MGNIMFTCRSPGTMAVRVNQRRRSSRLRLAFTCGCLAPSKQKRRSVSGKNSNNHRGSSSGWFSGTKCTTRPDVQRRWDSRSTSTRRDFDSSPSDNSRESFLLPTGEGSGLDSPSVDSPCSFYSSVSHSSPDRTSTSFNKHYSQQHGVNSPSSDSSPMTYSSPDMPSPTSRSSLTRDSSPDMRRKSFNKNLDQKRGVHSPTSRPSATSTPSPDLTRMYFNQHCYQQLHSVPSRKYNRSPRRNSKSGSLKSSRRKRTGMRSPSHRSSNCKSLARAMTGSYEEEDKRYEMRSQSHRTSNSKSLERILNGCTEDDEGKRYEMRSETTRTSKSKTLGGFLGGCNDESEEKHNAMPSPPQRTSYSTSSRRPANGRNGDNANGSPRYTSFSVNGQTAVGRVISSPISRRAALALISRHKLFANRKYSSSSGENCRRHCWKPALESISEAADWESF